MASIFDGIQSLSPQFQEAFRKTVEAEAKPIERLEERKGNIQEKVNLLNDIISRVDKVKEVLPSLSSQNALRELEVKSTQEEVINGTADKSVAVPGVHSIEVLQLASSASAVSNGFPDKDETRVGSGYFVFTTADGDTKELFIDNENGTLEDIATVINRSKVGMRASVINDVTDEENPFRLVLAAEGTGAENDVEYPLFYFVDGDEDFYIDRENPAMNARFKFEGLELEHPTNQVVDLIPGVTLNLTGTSPGYPARVSIENDVPSIIEKVKGFVENVNSVFSFIQEQNRIDENTPTQRTLGNDYGIRLTEIKFRDALRQNFIFDTSKRIRSLSDLGVMFNRNGTLDLDEKKLENAIDANYDEVVDVVAGDGIQYGVVPHLKRAIDAITRPRAGILTLQRKGFTDRTNRIQDDIRKKEDQVERKAQRLKEQLSKAQNALQSLQSQTGFFAGGGATAAALTQQLG